MNMDFNSAEKLLELCEQNQLPISEVMRQRECILGEMPRDAADHRMNKAWEIMRTSATQPLKKPIKSMGGLIGGEAKKLEAHYGRKKSICGDVLGKAMTYAMAVLEVNASMGLIVASPTAGSAGIVPGLMLAMQEHYQFSDEEIIQAAKASYSYGFIKRLPNGFDTVIGEDGGSLSQGQKQLLCITRIMLTRPPMLILDEATSSIDTRTEIRIQNAFAKLMEGRTSFIVAHRLSTIQSADVILVMKDGHIIEKGNHEELLAAGGFYKTLYESQFDTVTA